MFNINNFESSNFYNNNYNIIIHAVSLSNIGTDLFYKIATDCRKEGDFLIKKEKLRVIITFSYDKTNNNLDLIKLFISDGCYASETLLNFSNLEIEDEQLIKNRLLELIDFKESSKNEKLHDVVSKTLTKIVEDKKG